jgi:hypothetical protein
VVASDIALWVVSLQHPCTSSAPPPLNTGGTSRSSSSSSSKRQQPEQRVKLVPVFTSPSAQNFWWVIRACIQLLSIFFL